MHAALTEELLLEKSTFSVHWNLDNFKSIFREITFDRFSKKFRVFTGFLAMSNKTEQHTKNTLLCENLRWFHSCQAQSNNGSFLRLLFCFGVFFSCDKSAS